MKKLIAISAMTLMLTTCGISSTAATNEDATNEQVTNEESDHISFIDFMIQAKAEQTLLEEQAAQFEAAQLRAFQMQGRIQDLSQHVDKTWYVFSGSTPEGWDCSGLVMWFYSKFQVELEHSATAQKFSGERIDEPLPGDVVAFSYHGTKVAYHNGIYIGADLFIHSPRVGTQTRLSSVSDYAGEHSKISYTRIDF